MDANSKDMQLFWVQFYKLSLNFPFADQRTYWQQSSAEPGCAIARGKGTIRKGKQIQNIIIFPIFWLRNADKWIILRSFESKMMICCYACQVNGFKLEYLISGGKNWRSAGENRRHFQCMSEIFLRVETCFYLFMHRGF